MAQIKIPSPLKVRSAGEVWAAIGLAAVLAFFLISGGVAYRNVQVLRENSQRVLQSNTVVIALDELFSTVQDAETGQRGFLLTGADRYLQPYRDAVAAVPARLDAVAGLIADNPEHQAALAQVRGRIDAKLAELRQTVDLRRSSGAAAALEVVTTDRGKVEMDAIRAQIDAMRQSELQLRQTRVDERERA